MKYSHWNVHRTNAAHLASMLNSHADSGYEVYQIRGIGNQQRNDHLLVVFVRHFASAAERDAYRSKRNAPREEPKP